MNAARVMLRLLRCLAIATVCITTACDNPAAGSDASVDSPDARVVPCDSPRGTQHGLTLTLGDGIADRIYWLHVPASYRCDAEMPLLVDFHGTATNAPEEAYQTDALVAFAEAHGVIVARPRSRSSTEGGLTIYRWDQNAGDLARNIELAHRLVADLEQRYAIAPARVYASGFSSGSNMVAQFLGDASSPFHGLAPIAGGRWTTTQLPPLGAGPRLYLSTGYRDYLWPTARTLVADVLAAGLPASQLVLRPTGGGHDLYAWHFDELWGWLDDGIRPGTGALAAPWTEVALPAPADVLAFADDGGTLRAAGASGRTWQRDATWTLEQDHGEADYTALCFGGGTGIVGGGTAVAHRSGAAWTADVRPPDYGMLGTGSVHAAVCRADGSAIIGGDWTSAITVDHGATWAQLHVPTGFGVDAQIAGGAATAAGTTVLVGYYDTIARAGANETTATLVAHPVSAEWWNAAAAAGGRFWVVGDGGAILSSTDDGQTWQTQASGTTENLYGVHFADVQHGAIVGRRGTVLVTSDGGGTWMPRPLGRDVFLGAVWVEATTITVGGEGVLATIPR